MAKPQVENGYTAISNELLEAIYKTDLTKNELRILLCIARHTYGYHKKQSEFPRSFLESETGLTKPRITEAIAGLKSKNIIILSEAVGRKAQEISIQKNYEEWVPTGTFSVPVRNQNRYGKRTHMGTENVPVMGTENVPTTSNKENNKENIKKNSDFLKEQNPKRKNTGCIPEWFEAVWKEYPEKKGKNAISKKAYKELEQAGEETVRRALRGYMQDMKLNPWKHYMNGSTFFNGRWMDYIDEASEPDTDPYLLTVEEAFG